MNPFPVITSTLSERHLSLFLQAQYNLSTKTTCRLLKTGINHVYLINDGGQKSVFRVYSLNWRSEKEIAEEIRLLNLLHENELPVSYPVADANNNYIQKLNAPEGERFGVMFSYAKGEKVFSFSPELHKEIGKIMAEFHQLTHNLYLDRVTYTPEKLLIDSPRYFFGFLPEDSPEVEFIRYVQKHLSAKLKEVDETQIRKGVIHLDIWFDNLNISEEKEITIFDFDFCGNGWLSYDIAYYIMQIYSTEVDENEYLLKAESFLKGYEAITPLTNEERRILPMLGECIYLFYLGVQCQRFNNWSNTFINEVYLKRFINLRIKRWFDYNKLG
ncbi:phosphotransferase enzyme family protein [Emticicia sp. BO119]|uniref:phosphotransferase enzyme family protein n=1 Tax=Emticicia sp. BO119 TaxID=2757768 RepID=UPI0015F11893|nr:phosphotransferase [Emticicia sp. BO119]MBA4851183.1 phosphotransferase [Emticicia sp. BO119]